MSGNSLTVSRVRGCLHSLSKGPLEGARLNNLAHSYWLADAPVEAYLWACWATHPLAWGENNIDRKALFTLGNVLLDHGRFREAELVFTRLDSEEQDPQAKVARSLALEGQEKWAAAASQAEARFHLKVRRPAWSKGLNGWIGLLWIAFRSGMSRALAIPSDSRWLPKLLSNGTKVSFLVRPALVRLFQEGLSWLGSDLSVLDRTSNSIAGCHGSLLAFPGSGSWQFCHSVTDQAWLRLGVLHDQKRQQPRVGLVWSAGQYSRPHAGSSRLKISLQCALQRLCDVIHAAGCKPVSQFGAERTMVDALSLSCEQGLTPAADFYELALAMQRCDLLIGMDTAATSGRCSRTTLLAAVALGCSAALGAFTDRQRALPNFCLFRQAKPRDWMSAIDAIGSALQAWATS